MPYNSRISDITRGNFAWNGPPPAFMGEDIYNSRYQDITGTGDYQALMIGTQYQTWDRRVFAYVKYTDAGASAAAGNVLGPLANTTLTDITGFSNASDAPYVEDTAATWTPGAFVGFWCNIGTGTGLGQTRRIIGNTATRLWLERAFVTAPDTTSDLIIWSPYSTRLTPAASGITQRVSGVSIGAITTAQYGWMQTYGVCERVIVDAILTSNNLICPSAATAGTGLMAVGATTEDETFFAYGLQVGGTAQGTPAFLFACQG